ncbi:MAG: hypothetical protein FWG30_00055 [Eubacteriaceae bacterium]|nr:hypothetical protein [Eubacteriaceae bacterium]
MKYDGSENARSRHKWVCPMPKKASQCPNGQSCTPSRLGSIRHTSPSGGGTKKWKGGYSNRTSSERMSNRFLHDYGLSRLRVRLLRRYAFFAMIIGINIHLDAWLKAEAA